MLFGTQHRYISLRPIVLFKIGIYSLGDRRLTSTVCGNFGRFDFFKFPENVGMHTKKKLISRKLSISAFVGQFYHAHSIHKCILKLKIKRVR